jgi:hypothetical protein
MQPQKRIKSLEIFMKRKALTLKKLKKAQDKLHDLENKRMFESGLLVMKCGLAEKDNQYLEQAFLKIAKESLND